MAGKFWEKPHHEPPEMKPWSAWHTDNPPKDGSSFMARVAYNIAKAVRWDEETQQFVSGLVPVTVHQWLTFEEYGEVLQCVWKTPITGSPR